MTARRSRPYLRSLVALTALPGITFLSTSTFIPVAQADTVSVVAEAPQGFSALVTDTAGILSPEEYAQIEAAVQTSNQVNGLTLHIAFINDLDGYSPDQWRTQAQYALQSPRDALYYVAVEQKEYGIVGGSAWSTADLAEMKRAAQEPLSKNDFAGSALTVTEIAQWGADESRRPTGGLTEPDTNDGASLAWLGAGAAGVAAVGGGLFVYGKRKKKADTEKTLEALRNTPANVNELVEFPTDLLEIVAKEELVSTDESIKKAKEELELATAEFGEVRTRPFREALAHSSETLRKAFELQHRVQLGSYTDDYEIRNKLATIIAQCSQADDALDAQVDEYNRMRNLLVTAPEVLDKDTRSIVELRSRIPQAQHELSTLEQEFGTPLLTSIKDNVKMAELSADEADRLITMGRTILDKPAGEQGDLVDLIHAAEGAIAKSDRFLKAIENAKDDIAVAQDSLPGLIQEIEQEIAESKQLEAQGQQQGTQAQWEALHQVISRAQQELAQERTHVQIDPLGVWTRLTTLDSEIDELLDDVREKTQDHAHQLAVFDRQMAVADSTIQAAADFIDTRGRLIGSEARTHLANAIRLQHLARTKRVADTRAAIKLAGQATSAGQAALDSAQNDINRYNRRQSAQNASSGTGAFLAGMVLNGVLNGGNNGGGFSGGGSFGGGGGSFGGSFGGGGGGSFGGSF